MCHCAQQFTWSLVTQTPVFTPEISKYFISRDISPGSYYYSCVCVSVCTCTCRPVHTKAKGQPWYHSFFRLCSPYIWTVSIIDLGPPKEVLLTGPRAPGLCLPLPTQFWDETCLTFFCGSWGSELSIIHNYQPTRRTT